MNKLLRTEKTDRGPARQKTARSVLYFGVPILVALSSAIFPLSAFLRQAMIGFMLIWFVAGSWLFASPK
jgi:hypothetical protein